jgi:hypothetical protein
MVAFLLVWIGFIVITAVIAGSKNRSVGGWGLLAAFFGFFATIALACCERLPTAQEIAVSRAANEPTKKCPRCAESVKAAALVCRFCNHEFDPSSIPAADSVAALPWAIEEDHGNGYGVYRYKNAKLVYSSKGVKWKTSTFDNPRQAIAAIDGYC